MTGPDGSLASAPGDEVRLSLPASPGYSRVARLALTGMASRLGFSYDEVEDVRIAVGELFGVLLDPDGPREPGERLVLTCRMDAHLLGVRAALDPPRDLAEIAELSRQILGAVVDEVQIDLRIGTVAFTKVAEAHAMSEGATRRADQRALFEEYHRTRDPALRDRLVVANLRLALHLARQFANRGIPTDDLEQVASYGLLRAVDRFDPTRGLEFSTFATPTILGELKRHFRDRGWSVRVPRRVQELHVRLSSLVPELTNRLGRSPTIAEIAREARASVEEVLEAMEAGQAYRSHSLDVPDGSGATDGFGTVDEALFAAEDRVVVEALLAELPPRDQLLIRLRFYEEMSQHEIARRLGISQMHVSRLLGKTLQELRRRLDETPRDLVR